MMTIIEILFVDDYFFSCVSEQINCFCVFDFMMLVVEKVLHATIVICIYMNQTMLCCNFVVILVNEPNNDSCCVCRQISES